VSDWEAVIGLEVHAQLKTRAKLFSSAPNGFGGEPNSRTTEVDLGLPGVLPVINEAAVELALRAALALDCEIQPVSRFARKHYFYPDLPKGYQISQYDEPYALGGAVPAELDGDVRRFKLTRIHMEEDAAKSVHDSAVTGDGATHVNLNRAGVPLVEIVSEPDLRTPEEAGAYLRSLRSVLRYLDVSDADMEKGQFRCDANVSVRRAGDAELGVKVEVKNLNSFRNVERAIAYEIERQIQLLGEGGEIAQETRHWDDQRNVSIPSRGKEDADDYRYFPDPDLAPLVIETEQIEKLRASLPELPLARRKRFETELGLPAEDARTLTEDRAVADFFEATLALHDDTALVANWIKRSLLQALSESGLPLDELPLTPHHLARLLELLAGGAITPASAREVFAAMVETGAEPEAVVQERGLEAVSDSGELEALAREAIDAHPTQVEQFRAGEGKVLNFFIGQVMKRTQGKADPGVARELLERLLAERM
jgi:aspartyl-tRNA(Asn)/glutamyl-tRNA(Gln) amidotransferase subunit B